jgi:peptidyl-prolyl cis-trans isomerase D
MATLENIRKKGPLLAVVIGVALLAFILGDAFRSGGTLFSGSRFEIANIRGESISLQEYSQNVEDLANIYKMRTGGQLDENTYESIRKQVWEQMVQESVLGEEYHELGITVTSDELFDMVQGTNVDPTIRQMFRNPETGQFNRAYVIQFLKNLESDPNNKAFWLYLESELITKRRYQKYLNLVSKGLYVNKLEAKTDHWSKNKSVDIKYIGEKYTTIPDSSVSITDSDIEDYYKSHKEEYKQEESRDLAYVAFKVEPSQDDKQYAQEWIEEIKPEFESTDNIEQFLRINDPENPFDRKYYKENELPTNLAVFLFNAEIGEVYGPYLEDETYKLVKLLDTEYLPDSVKARHILKRPQSQNAEAYRKARNTIDSLKQLIEEGTDFAELAEEHSDDGTAEKGGDLGWFEQGQMVRAFNDTCFFGSVGDIKVVESQFGVHLVEILDKAPDTLRVQYATLNRKIEPSKETRDNVYSEAARFAAKYNTGTRFEQGVSEEGVIKKLANNIAPLEKNIAGLEQPRPFIRAAYKTGLNEIIRDEQNNPVFELGDQFVVGKVTAIREEEYSPVEQVRSMITVEVTKEKKAGFIKSKFEEAYTGANNIEAISANLGLEVKEASNIRFSSYQIPGLGFEPAVIGTALSLDENEISRPIEGRTGVYIVSAFNVKNLPETDDYSSSRKNLARSVRSRANYQVYDALKDKVEVEDKRSKFY